MASIRLKTKSLVYQQALRGAEFRTLVSAASINLPVVANSRRFAQHVVRPLYPLNWSKPTTHELTAEVHWISSIPLTHHRRGPTWLS